ncbi:MFS transporter, partial [Georgenia sp. 10Sc9-8]|nr:MFS transporter [Georgenia halotolerans]
GQLVVGSVSDAVGRRRPLVVSLALYAAVALGIAAAASVELLIVLRLGQGVLGSAGMVIAMAVVRDTYGGVQLGRTISRLMLVVGVAPVLAPALGSQLLLVASWRLLFVALAAVALLLLVLVLVGLEESLPPERRRTGGTGSALRTYARLLRDPVVLGLVLVVGFVMAGQFAYVTTSTFVFQESYGVSPQLYGLLFGLGALAVTAGTQVTGVLLGRRVRGTRILGGALLVAAVGSATMVVVAQTVGTGPGGLIWLMAALLPTITAVGVAFPAVPTLVLARQERDAGAAASLVGAVQFGMAALGAPLSGLLGNSATSMAGVMLALFTVAGALVLVVARREPSL